MLLCIHMHFKKHSLSQFILHVQNSSVAGNKSFELFFTKIIFLRIVALEARRK